MPRALIVVPWRDKGDPSRRRNLERVLDHITDLELPPAVIVSDGRDGSAPFNRSAAYNAAVWDNPADVYVFHEADMLVPHGQLRAAIDQAAAAPGLVVPFDIYHYLSQADTQRLHEGADGNFAPEYAMTDGRAVGAVNVVSAATMAAVGQWDERFEGWGFDDRAMARAFQIATGAPTRHVVGVGIHLWHTPGWTAKSRFHGGAADIAPDEHEATDANAKRYKLYQQARTPARIRQLTSA